MAPSDDHPYANAGRLFRGSCVALIATSVAFATVGAVMLDLKNEFVLTNEQVGWIGGAALWGFALSQVVFAPLADTLGFRTLLRTAFAAHLIGTITLMIGGSFAYLFTGALIISMGNGLVEAACNPLVAALYPGNKTVKLNNFHVWFPGGIVLGGLAAYGLDQLAASAAGLEALGEWRVKIALIVIPTLVYGHMLLRERFPPTEGVQAGVSVGEMFRAALTTPFMLLMLFAMTMTASIEIGPTRWVPAVLEAGGIPGILVLVWINGLMAVLRHRAGTVVHRLSPPGVLLVSAALSGVGLLAFSYASGTAAVFLTATVFAVGICYIWPTMLGVVSERVPKSGALGLGLMGAVGMATTGLVTAPQMGRIADVYAHDQLPVAEVVALFERADGELAGVPGPDASAARAAAVEVVDEYQAAGTLPSPATANALRQIIDSGAGEGLTGEAQAILGPADNFGGRISFRYLVPLCAILMVIFGVLRTRARKEGGYRARRIAEAA